MSIIRDTVRVTNQFTRNVSTIRRVGIHHTGVDRSNIDCRESLNRHRNHWRSLGWTNDGYNEVIARDGRVFILHDPNHIANGVGNHNTDTYQIAFEGLGSIITPIQRTRLIERIRNAQQQFNIANASVLGHNEFPGHTGNSCPGINMTTLRSDVAQGSTTPPTPPPAGNIQVGSDVRVNNNAQTWATGQPIPAWVRGEVYRVQEMRNNNSELLLAGIISWIRHTDVTLVSGGGGGVTHTVQAGETLWGISQMHGTTVAAIQALNGMGTSTVISVGQVLRVR